MNYNSKAYTESFAQYIQSMVKLDALEKMTADLDRELADSQNIMKEIKTLFHSVPAVAPQQNERNHQEEFAQFLETETPNLLLPDMVAANNFGDIDKIVETMKNYAEELRQNINTKEQSTKLEKINIESLDLTSYATNFDQLSKSLANIKITSDVNKKNAELEDKLGQLCEDVTSFTKLVQVTEGKYCRTPTSTVGVLTYDNILNKLLADITEVTYLLKSNN
ncbi:unnamed protein product [Leptosia nina]|uniref:Uncharacterized protein n=1 Tax=Leptosia nina TaxID=320188 RepID=A0AAV1JHY3_9NEOP